MATPASLRDVVRMLVDAARSEDLGFLAAAIAYYAFVSLVPLALLGLVIASVVGGDALATAVRGAMGDLLSAEAASLLEGAIGGGAGRSGATVVSLVVLGWSGLRLFRGLHVAVARIYGTRETSTFGGQLRVAAATLGAIAVALGSLAVVLAVLPTLPAGTMLAPFLTILLLPVAFYPLYYVLPDVSLSLREAVPGAVFAGLGWTGLGWAFALYALYASTVSIYGAVGTVLLVLTWFYAGALIILLGAVLNAVLAGRTTNRQLQQVAGRDDG